MDNVSKQIPAATPETADPRPTIALVTGANSGIGKQIARQLIAKEITVHVGSRDPSRG